MPAKTVYSEEIQVNDHIEIAGAFLTVTNVLVQSEVTGQVWLTAIPVDHEDLVFELTLPKFWPTNIRRM